MSVWERVAEEELSREPATGRRPRAPRKPRRSRSRPGRQGFRGIEVYGINETAQALEDYVPELEKVALHTGARKAANMVADLARARAPVGDEHTGLYSYKKHSPGRLKKSIHVRKERQEGRQVVYSVTLGGRSLFVGDIFYGGFVEMGWHHTGNVRKRSAKKPGKWIPGQGFLRSSLYDLRGRIYAIFRYEVQTKNGQIVDRVRKGIRWT